MVEIVGAETVVEPFGGLFTEVISGRAYLVRYDEDVWKSLDAERQQFCKDTWIAKATAVKDVRFVVLKLIPDDLFPMHGHDTPYVDWQYQIDRPPECGFQITTLVTVEITGNGKYVDPVMRSEISKQLKLPRYPEGAAFCIVNERGDIIERGRV